VYRFGVQGKKKIVTIKNKLKMLEFYKSGKPPQKNHQKKPPGEGFFRLL